MAHEIRIATGTEPRAPLRLDPGPAQVIGVAFTAPIVGPALRLGALTVEGRVHGA